MAGVGLDTEHHLLASGRNITAAIAGSSPAGREAEVGLKSEVLQLEVQRGRRASCRAGSCPLECQQHG